MGFTDMVNILLALLGFLLSPGVLNTARLLQHHHHHHRYHQHDWYDSMVYGLGPTSVINEEKERSDSGSGSSRWTSVYLTLKLSAWSTLVQGPVLIQLERVLVLDQPFSFGLLRN